MKDQAKSIIKDLPWRESHMSAFMSENPDAGTEEALDESVQGPQGEAGRVGWDVGWSTEGVEDVEGDEEAEEILEDVEEGLEEVSLKAVAGDGVVDLLDCIVWDSELFAV
jgi:hypothetical protein